MSPVDGSRDNLWVSDTSDIGMCIMRGPGLSPTSFKPLWMPQYLKKAAEIKVRRI